MMHFQPALFAATPLASNSLPERPDARVLNGVTPFFFVGRNKHGFWRAREARGTDRRHVPSAALGFRFAQEASAPPGCATMLLAKPFELEAVNAGNPIVGWIDAVLDLVSRFIPDYPAADSDCGKLGERDFL